MYILECLASVYTTRASGNSKTHCCSRVVYVGNMLSTCLLNATPASISPFSCWVYLRLHPSSQSFQFE
jgi:hypothetical protein